MIYDWPHIYMTVSVLNSLIMDLFFKFNSIFFLCIIMIKNSNPPGCHLKTKFEKYNGQIYHILCSGYLKWMSLCLLHALCIGTNVVCSWHPVDSRIGEFQPQCRSCKFWHRSDLLIAGLLIVFPLSSIVLNGKRMLQYYFVYCYFVLLWGCYLFEFKL